MCIPPGDKGLANSRGLRMGQCIPLDMLVMSLGALVLFVICSRNLFFLLIIIYVWLYGVLNNILHV